MNIGFVNPKWAFVGEKFVALEILLHNIYMKYIIGISFSYKSSLPDHISILQDGHISYEKWDEFV